MADWLYPKNVVGGGGIYLDNWEFDHPLLNDPAFYEIRKSLLDCVGETIRNGIKDNPSIELSSSTFGTITISLFIGEVDDGYVQWDITLSKLLEIFVDRLPPNDITIEQKEEAATALELTAARLRSGDYGEKQ
jgi:hypothetical protein